MKTYIQFPFEIANPIVQNIDNVLNEIGYKKVENIQDTNLVLLGWFENISTYPFPGFNMKKNIKNYVKFKLDWFEKIKDKKIVYFLHNLEAHNKKGIEESKKLQEKIIKRADKIVILNEKFSTKHLRKFLTKDEIQKKVVFIPHPLYKGEYIGSKKQNDNFSNNNALILSTFGIRNQKFSENLYKVIKDLNSEGFEIKLNIAEPKTSDEDLHKTIINSHLTIIQNSPKQLNSGRVVLSATLKRNIIMDIPNKNYFNIPKEMLEFSIKRPRFLSLEKKYKKQIVSIYKKYEGKFDQLLKSGQKLGDYLYSTSNDEILIEKYRELLESLED